VKVNSLADGARVGTAADLEDQAKLELRGKILNGFAGSCNPKKIADMQALLAEDGATWVNSDNCPAYLAQIRNAYESVQGFKAERANMRGSLADQISAAEAELANNADPESPSSLKKACADKDIVIQKTGQNLMSLMSSMQQNQACANELATFKGLDTTNCELFGTCDSGGNKFDCSLPENKNELVCKQLTKAVQPGGGAGNGNPNGNPNFGLDDKGYLTGLDMDGDASGGFGGDDPNGLGKMADNGGMKSPGVPGGGGGGGLNIPGGPGNPGRAGGRGMPSGDGSSFGGSPSYASGLSFGGNGDKNQGDGARNGNDPSKNLTAIDLPNGEKMNTSGPNIFQKVRAALYYQVKMDNMHQPDISLPPVGN
jgi:hypothetical protein